MGTTVRCAPGKVQPTEPPNHASKEDRGAELTADQETHKKSVVGQGNAISHHLTVVIKAFLQNQQWHELMDDWHSAL